MILIVQAVDTPETGNPERDKLRFLKGQVIARLPDTWKPGRGEKDDPNFLIVQVSGTEADFDPLTEDWLKADPAKATARRAKVLDIETLKTGGKMAARSDAKLGSVSTVSKVELDKAVLDIAAAEVIN